MITTALSFSLPPILYAISLRVTTLGVEPHDPIEPRSRELWVQRVVRDIDDGVPVPLQPLHDPAGP